MLHNDIEMKKVWVAWTNTDLTEGKGFQIPYKVCGSLTTAMILGKGKSVQGTNCNITEEVAVKIAKHWLGPVEIVSPSKQEWRMDIERERRASALQRAREAGLDEADIELIAKPIKE